MPSPPPSVAHIGLAVPDAEAAAAFYRDVLGTAATRLPSADGATIVSCRFGDVDLELLEPETSDSPIAKFLAKRGPGIHHVCFRVPDLAEALRRCREKGYRLVDETPRSGAHGRPIAFVHPKATAGILLELTEENGDA